MTNMNPDTGIRYGYISAQSLHPDVVHELLYGPQAVNEAFEESQREYVERARRRWEILVKDLADAKIDFPCLVKMGLQDSDSIGISDFDRDLAEEEHNETYYGDEEIISGTYEGVNYRSSWLGGALNFWIFNSPVVTKCGLCSPCVPNAGNLDTEGDFEAYGVPEHWLYKED